MKQTLLLGALAVGGVGLLFSLIPGSPVWRIFNPGREVVRPAITSSEDSAGEASSEQQTLRIVTLLPKDAIPAIPESSVSFLSGAAAEAQMQPGDRIIGLSINGDHRAYSTAQLSSHEVVNDTVGGKPVAVTW